MSAKSVAIVTSSKNPRLSGSSRILAASLKRNGYTVTSFPWDSRNNGEAYSTLLPLECWNYHLHRQEFLDWLTLQESGGIRIFNPLQILRWNTDKSYLLELERKGIPVIPSIILYPNDGNSVQAVMEKQRWRQAIRKPTVGASAYGTEKISLHTASATDEGLDRTVPWILQEYVEEISKGEYSFIFFNKTFSHAVLKVPKANEFRVHIDFGGTETPVKPHNNLISQAAAIVHAVEGPLLYARVDAIEKEGKLTLMELELTEPYLFFDADSGAADRFVEAYKLL